ncbi:MAG TPA: hypothetical protein PK710_05770 [Polyangiaceae bacterium]|nr:hypothetical protein [Polyangiaceae bacterium]
MMAVERRSVIAAMACFAGLFHSMSAAYADQSGQEVNADGSGSSCVISGDAIVVKDTPIFSEAVGGNPVAKFSGAKAPLKATRCPSDSSTGRVLINTGAGFRVEGFTDPRALKAFGIRDLPVSGSLWISASAPLTIVGSAPGKVQVEHPAMAGLSRPIRAWAPCDAITFTQGSAPIYEVPKNARGYVARQGALDIYASAGGDVAHTLSISGEGNGLLLWGTTLRAGFVHVTMRSSIFIDGWVKTSEVRALPRGELMDQLAPPTQVQLPPALALKEYLSVMRAPKPLSLYYGRGEANPTMGMVEQDAEIYVLETVVGWATVLPKSLHVLPVSDRAFWVKATELGIGAKPDGGGP